MPTSDKTENSVYFCKDCEHLNKYHKDFGQTKNSYLYFDINLRIIVLFIIP